MQWEGESWDRGVWKNNTGNRGGGEVGNEEKTGKFRGRDEILQWKGEREVARERSK